MATSTRTATTTTSAATLPPQTLGQARAEEEEEEEEKVSKPALPLALLLLVAAVALPAGLGTLGGQRWAQPEAELLQHLYSMEDLAWKMEPPFGVKCMQEVLVANTTQGFWATFETQEGTQTTAFVEVFDLGDRVADVEHRWELASWEASVVSWGGLLGITALALVSLVRVWIWTSVVRLFNETWNVCRKTRSSTQAQVQKETSSAPASPDGIHPVILQLRSRLSHPEVAFPDYF